MKIFKRSLLVLAALLLIAAVSLLIFTSGLKPSYEGNLVLKGLSGPVEVYYDDNGVPHIYAENELDAERVLGYVHAQDRLWQMELLRRIATGRLSELFGKKLVRTDRFFSGLGIEENTAKTVENLDKNSDEYKLTMAYLEGVNQFIAKGPTPIEFYLLGIDKKPYTIEDVYNVYGYMAFSFAHAYKVDPLLTDIKDNLGEAYLRELQIKIDSASVLIKSQQNPIVENGIARAVNDIYDNLPFAPFIGSNSWVIGPEKTKNGKVIFANDPHIGYAQPSVWYQSHLVTPEHEMYGYNLALIPFPLLGHNREYAYGLTMFENDDLDFYYEENNPQDENEYRSKDHFEKYEFRNKTIKIKDGKDTTYTIKVSKHGPLVNGIIDQVKGDRPVAMDWAYTRLPNKILEVNYRLSHAHSLDEFRAGAALLHAPGLNIMYGDADNNIAWFASGKLYRFHEGVNSKLILDGTDGNDEKIAYLDFSENPQAVNPDWHYVYSANNQPDSIAGMLYPGYYLPFDRAKRIVGLLEAKNDFTKDDVMHMINDITNANDPLIVKEALQHILRDSLSDNQQKSYDILNKWDGSYELQSAAPTIYNRFLYEFLVSTYKDELGGDFKLFLNSHIQKKNVLPQIMKDSSVWWDDINTKDVKEARKDIVTGAFKNAVSFLENQLGPNSDDWTWNRVHTLEFKHPIGEVAMMRGYFNVGPFEVKGGNEVINNQIFNLDSTGYYRVHAGPSTRRVIDFSDVDNSMTILPTGQSGNPQSEHYSDQAQKFLNGEFVRMLLDEKEIRASKNKLVFTAEN
ncbi:MAG: penicillin acylase family protein [Flavobacteriaceae bacterium]|nr:penicillin acylase family protein [Flavobacteriaceae bacterium]